MSCAGCHKVHTCDDPRAVEWRRENGEVLEKDPVEETDMMLRDDLYYIVSGEIAALFVPGSTTPAPDGGEMIDGANLKRVRALISIRSIEDTDYEGVKRLGAIKGAETPKPVPPPLPYDVKVTNHWDGGVSKKLTAELAGEIFGGRLGYKQILLTTPHNRMEAAATEGFHIHFWSSPVTVDESGVTGDWIGPGDERKPMWGSKSYCSSIGDFGRWEEGTQITCPEGYEVAACDEHNLYFYFDATHFGQAHEAKIIKKVFEIAADIIQNKRFAPPIPATATDKDRYIRICSRRPYVATEEADKTMVKIAEQVQAHQQAMANLLRTMEEARRVSEKKPETHPDKYALEFDRLASHPRIKSIGIKKNAIIIHTKMVYITHPVSKKVYEIGEFKAVLNLNQCTIRFENLTRRVNAYNDGMHHPHVFPDGRPCWGNMEVALPQYIAACEIAAVVEIMFAFLDQANTDPTHRYQVENWPLAATQPVNVEAAVQMFEAAPKTEEAPETEEKPKRKGKLRVA